MQIYPITMHRNRHVILKHYLRTFPTQPSALLGPTVVVVYCVLAGNSLSIFRVDKSFILS